MRTMMIYKGLPGSGKSTQAAAIIKDEPKRWIRINRDDLRSMVAAGGNPYDKDREKLMRIFKEELVRKAFASGYDVILDDTHLVSATVKSLHTLAALIGDVTVVEKGVNVDVQTCIERDSNRTGFARVGKKVIMDMAKGAGIDKGRQLLDKQVYYEPRSGPSQPVVQDETLPEAIMCDLDGTLAIIGDRSPYDATDCDLKDKPNWPVIRCVMAMHATGTRIVFMSGREAKHRPETIRFIEKYCTVNGSVIPYALHMRGEGSVLEKDTRKDSVIKQELFNRYVRGQFNILFVLDDRNQVVDFWRSMGLTCFQVAPGAFLIHHEIKNKCLFCLRADGTFSLDKGKCIPMSGLHRSMG